MFFANGSKAAIAGRVPKGAELNAFSGGARTRACRAGTPAGYCGAESPALPLDATGWAPDAAAAERAIVASCPGSSGLEVAVGRARSLGFTRVESGPFGNASGGRNQVQASPGLATRHARVRAPQIAVLLPFLLLAGCGDKPPATQAREEAPVAVQTVALAPVEWPQTFEATGTVRARSTAAVSARVMGYVEQVLYREGDSVAAGALLARIDSRDMESGLRQAEAALNEARSAQPEAESAIAGAKAQMELAQITHGRMKDLLEKRSVSQQEMDEANARLRQAESAYAMAKARLEQAGQKIRQAEQTVESARIQRGFTNVSAPFAGRIVELPREEEPQIIVPMIDVFVGLPGASAREVESASPSRWRSCCGRSPASSTSTRPPAPAWRWPSCASRSARTKRSHRPAEPEDVRQLRPDPARRHAAADQAALDRRCADPGAHAASSSATATTNCAAWPRRCTTPSSRCRRLGGDAARRPAARDCA
jgi:biotin carboxyl carrier protein